MRPFFIRKVGKGMALDSNSVFGGSESKQTANAKYKDSESVSKGSKTGTESAINKTGTVSAQTETNQSKADAVTEQLLKDAKKYVFYANAPGTPSDWTPFSADSGNGGNGGNSGEDAKNYETVYVGGDNNNYSAGTLADYIKNLKNNSSEDTSTGSVAEETSTPTIEERHQALMEAANERLKQAYEYQQAQLQKAKDDALREAFIKQQMAQRAYPEQLAAAGINGGAAQGVLARNNSDYAKQRTDVYNNYLSGIDSAGQTYQQGIMTNNENFLASMAAYEQALEQMQKQYEYDEKLAKLKASLS